jgi:hypothetical protein
MRSPNFENVCTERFREWDSLYDKHFSWGTEDLLTILIKAHLLVEQHLTALIRHKCHDTESLIDARLGFLQKVNLVKALIAGHCTVDFWNSVVLLNTLRNSLAHELEPKKLAAYLATLRQQSKKLGITVPVILADDFKTDSGLLKAMLCKWLGDLGALDAFVVFEEKKKVAKHKPRRKSK